MPATRARTITAVTLMAAANDSSAGVSSVGHTAETWAVAIRGPWVVMFQLAQY